MRNNFGVKELDTSFVTIENDEECANEIRNWMTDTQMQIGFDIWKKIGPLSKEEYGQKKLELHLNEEKMKYKSLFK